ncbi:transposase [Streptomyces auratus]|uniref:Transposase n=1 Tax=Streptomyces auratus AGR0001 TaxID=1160718 RepID=J2A4E2_9ACTN|nr:transposase [Streptomyces auratus AGR0001]
MGRKSPYPEEFRKDAVALYRAAAGKRTYAAVAADLGITVESLRTWVRKEEAQAAPGRREADMSEAEELARLRAENARLCRLRREADLPGARCVPFRLLPARGHRADPAPGVGRTNSGP